VAEYSTSVGGTCTAGVGANKPVLYDGARAALFGHGARKVR
jgi:hypothetical protein